MPSFPPRSEPTKKADQLMQRKKELIFAINKAVEAEILIKFIHNYRKAQLSKLKARIHQAKENELRKKINNVTLEKLQEQVIEWSNKTNEEIIAHIKEITN